MPTWNSKLDVKQGIKTSGFNIIHSEMYRISNIENIEKMSSEYLRILIVID